MTEEKKDDLNEQQSFLNDHEKLLKSINEKKGEPEQAEPTEIAPEAETVEAAPKETPETAPEIETPEAEPEEVIEAVSEETPQAAAPEVAPPVAVPEAKEEPKQVAKTVAPAPSQKAAPKTLGGKKKKKAQHHPHTERDDAEAERHKEVLKHQELEQQEVKEVLTFLKKFAKPTLITVIVIFALVMANGVFKNQRLKKEVMADTALINAQSPEDLQAIIDDYASTPSEPFALMGLAREKFNEGKIDEAEALYTRFAKKHGGHELAAQAELNLISCKEAKGQPEEASRLYGEFAKANEGSHLVPSAMMSQARCLETLGKLDEAQIVYEDLIAAFPESSWAQLANIDLKKLLSKKQ